MNIYICVGRFLAVNNFVVIPEISDSNVYKTTQNQNKKLNTVKVAMIAATAIIPGVI